jgi:hypothetical protein
MLLKDNYCDMLIVKIMIRSGNKSGLSTGFPHALDPFIPTYPQVVEVELVFSPLALLAIS